MKMLLSSLVVLFSSASFAMAPEVCTAAYAVGLGHLFKGESHLMGNKEQFNVGKKVQDEFYVLQTKLVDGKLVAKLTQKSTGQEVEMKTAMDDNELIMLATAPLSVYPDGVPGAALYKGVHLMLLCAPKID